MSSYIELPEQQKVINIAGFRNVSQTQTEAGTVFTIVDAQGEEHSYKLELPERVEFSHFATVFTNLSTRPGLHTMSRVVKDCGIAAESRRVGYSG